MGIKVRVAGAISSIATSLFVTTLASLLCDALGFGSKNSFYDISFVIFPAGLLYGFCFPRKTPTFGRLAHIIWDGQHSARSKFADTFETKRLIEHLPNVPNRELAFEARYSHEQGRSSVDLELFFKNWIKKNSSWTIKPGKKITYSSDFSSLPIVVSNEENFIVIGFQIKKGSRNWTYWFTRLSNDLVEHLGVNSQLKSCCEQKDGEEKEDET